MTYRKTRKQLFELLHDDDDLKARVEAYLGTETNELYKYAVVTCEEVVRNLAAHIEGFLPADQMVRLFVTQKCTFAGAKRCCRRTPEICMLSSKPMDLPHAKAS